MSAISVFNFSNNEVRVFQENGEVMFVAIDICKSLGLSNPTRALSTLDEDEKMVLTIGKGQKSGRGGAQSYNVVNESGMYHLIFKSRKKEAVQFRKWVTGEVLPSIRKTGTYTIPQTITPKQKLAIRDAMAKKVYDNYGKKQIPTGFKTEWHDFYEAFDISKYEELPADRFDDAMGYILGEWIPEQEALAIPQGMVLVNKQNFDGLCKLADMMYERMGKVKELEDKVFIASQAAQDASRDMMHFREATLGLSRELHLFTHANQQEVAA